jgi:thiamine biosynthesis lipoprotein
MFSRIQSLSNLFSRSRTGEKRFRHSAYYENILGTSLEIQVVVTDQACGTRAEAAVLAEIDRLEKIFNAYNPHSELAQWQGTFKQNITVSSELAHLLHEAEKWRILTKGAFNPATEALTRLWQEHARSGQIVIFEELAPLVKAINAPLWEVDLKESTANRLTDLPVTLNSIAKGFIIDRACAVASASENVVGVLINIGGDLRHFGDKSLNVAVADPRNDAENAVPLDRVTIFNQGMATSGNYRRGFQVGKQWYSHILNPCTGWPVESLVGVSVVAPDALSADVLATAFSILSVEESLELSDKLPSVALLLIENDGCQTSNTYWNQIHTGPENY